MSDEIFLAGIIGPFYVVLGLSVLLYSERWKRVAEEWLKKDFSLMGLMMFTLIFGLVVILRHNVWEWDPFIIITITGWSAFLKGVAYFLLPEKSLKSVVRAFNRVEYYQGIGMVVAALGIWLCYLIYVA